MLPCSILSFRSQRPNMQGGDRTKCGIAASSKDDRLVTTVLLDKPNSAQPPLIQGARLRSPMRSVHANEQEPNWTTNKADEKTPRVMMNNREVPLTEANRWRIRPTSRQNIVLPEPPLGANAKGKGFRQVPWRKHKDTAVSVTCINRVRGLTEHRYFPTDRCRRRRASRRPNRGVHNVRGSGKRVAGRFFQGVRWSRIPALVTNMLGGLTGSNKIR